MGSDTPTGSCIEWTTQAVGTYSNGEATLALIDADGRERMYGTEAEVLPLAAAMDLLAACKAAQAVLTDGHEPVWQQLTAAIARAEGN